jgi:hypothetical protein
MSRLVTAATQLLKLADELEAQAEAKTAFVCAGCGHVNTLGGINAAIRKYASEQTEPFDLQKNLVTVDDSCKCPSCGGAMKYMPTAESEKFYVVMADEDTDPQEDPGASPDAQPVGAPVVPEEAPLVGEAPTEVPGIQEGSELPGITPAANEEGTPTAEGFYAGSPEEGKKEDGDDEDEESTPGVTINQEKLARYLG